MKTILLYYFQIYNSKSNNAKNQIMTEYKCYPTSYKKEYLISFVKNYTNLILIVHLCPQLIESIYLKTKY